MVDMMGKSEREGSSHGGRRALRAAKGVERGMIKIEKKIRRTKRGSDGNLQVENDVYARCGGGSEQEKRKEKRVTRAVEN
jgi:hypothetical protein